MLRPKPVAPGPTLRSPTSGTYKSCMSLTTETRSCIEFAFALLEVEISLSELVLRYQFVREGFEAIEQDPEFQLTGILGRWTCM